jgi:hypothetical protein
MALDYSKSDKHILELTTKIAAETDINKLNIL